MNRARSRSPRSMAIFQAIPVEHPVIRSDTRKCASAGVVDAERSEARLRVRRRHDRMLVGDEAPAGSKGAVDAARDRCPTEAADGRSGYLRPHARSGFMKGASTPIFSTS